MQGGWLCVKWRVVNIKLSLENNWLTNRNKQEIVDFNLNNKPYRYYMLTCIWVYTCISTKCCILIWFQDKAYSFESSQELLEKDIVQLHAPRWHPLRRVCICFINGLCSKFLSCRDWWLQCRCIECTVRIIACYCKTRLFFIVAAEI